MLISTLKVFFLPSLQSGKQLTKCLTLGIQNNWWLWLQFIVPSAGSQNHIKHQDSWKEVVPFNRLVKLSEKYAGGRRWWLEYKDSKHSWWVRISILWDLWNFTFGNTHMFRPIQILILPSLFNTLLQIIFSFPFLHLSGACTQPSSSAWAELEPMLLWTVPNILGSHDILCLLRPPCALTAQQVLL